MEPKKGRISLIAALGERTRALGKDNGLLWQLPEDMRLFKELTTGHPVIMGRKTWDSIPEKFRPLPNRTNIVVTRSVGSLPGAQVAGSIPEALEIARTSPGCEEIFVIGGGEIYKQSLSLVDRLYLTLVDDDTEGDTFFPEYPDFTNVITTEPREGSPSYTFVTLER